MKIDMQVTGTGSIKDILKSLTSAESDKAIQMGINRTADKGRAEVNRSILERYAIKPDEVRNSVIVRPAHKRQAVAEAIINIFGSPSRRGRSMNMVRFLSALAGMKTRGSKAKQKDIKALGDQLGFQITKGGGIKKIPGAFVGNRGRTVFRRVASKYMSSRSGASKHSEAIEPIQVIGVSQMFNSKVIRNRVMSKMSADFQMEIERAVAAVIAKRK